MSRDKEIVARFLREGYVANTITHKGVVRVLDDDVTEDGAVFLVLELLEGESLASMLTKNGGRLPWMQVADKMVELLDVLSTAHSQGVVHRDIKPDNVFLTTEGVLKVLDFGLARFTLPDKESTRGPARFWARPTSCRPSKPPEKMTRSTLDRICIRSVQRRTCSCRGSRCTLQIRSPSICS